MRDGKDIVLIKAEKEVLLRDVAHIASVGTAVKGTKLMLAVIEKEVGTPMSAAEKMMAVEDLVDMTAMVDIVFFVLIFFMVTSMEGVYSSIEMPSPDPQKMASPGRIGHRLPDDKEFVVVRIDKENTFGQRHGSPERTGTFAQASRNTAGRLAAEPNARARQQRGQARQGRRGARRRQRRGHGRDAIGR